MEGHSPAPIYLWISDEGVELRDARALWFLPTGAALETIRAQTIAKAGVAAIALRGWDANGAPTLEKLQSLELPTT